MSYDIHLMGDKCPTCEHQPRKDDLGNPTYNLTPMFDFALTGKPMPKDEPPGGAVVLLRAKTRRPYGLRILSGRKAGETLPVILKALSRMDDLKLRGKFLALNPPNHWGDFDGAVNVMKNLRWAAEANPEMTWEIH
jgi:hypothetical protein